VKKNGDTDRQGSPAEEIRKAENKRRKSNIPVQHAAEKENRKGGEERGGLSSRGGKVGGLFVGNKGAALVKGSHIKGGKRKKLNNSEISGPEGWEEEKVVRESKGLYRPRRVSQKDPSEKLENTRYCSPKNRGGGDQGAKTMKKRRTVEPYHRRNERRGRSRKKGEAVHH